jgi:hypothetical protein
MDAMGQTPPVAGDIVITEMMVNPEAVSDSYGEWFEIWNSTDHSLLMNGLVLKDAGSNEHVITSTILLVLPAKGYWVMVKNPDSLSNGGVRGNYHYQNFTLNNTSDLIMITTGDGRLIDQVAYSKGWPIASGASLSLEPDKMASTANDNPENWFQAGTPYGLGDKGSPGLPNPVIAGAIDPVNTSSLAVYPNPSSGQFIMEAVFNSPQNGSIHLVNLLGQSILVKEFSLCTSLNEIVQANRLSPGIWFVKVKTGNFTRTKRIVILE